MESVKTRKSSCVNARGTLTTAYQVLPEVGYPPPPVGVPLHDCKRHTACHLASTHSVVCLGAAVCPLWVPPGWDQRPGKEPGTGVLPRKGHGTRDLGMNLELGYSPCGQTQTRENSAFPILWMRAVMMADLHRLN